MVLDSLPVAVCAVDREGKVVLWNDGAERVTGYLRQDVLGRVCTEAFGATYGNWELSADRANAAPRTMQGNGIREDQVTQVRGFADERLRKPDTPLDPSNRRISLIVQYLERKPAADADDAGEKSEGGHGAAAEKSGKEAGEKKKE
jgi:PAS domain-containing protein